MSKSFKSSVTLRLPTNITKRANTALKRFPFTNPHAFGLHVFTIGLKAVESAPEIARGITDFTTPPRPGTKKGPAR